MFRYLVLFILVSNDLAFLYKYVHIFFIRMFYYIMCSLSLTLSVYESDVYKNVKFIEKTILNRI